MTKVKIGVGRFYNANACSIVGAEEINLVFKFEGFDVHAYAGRGLKHTVMSWKFDPPVPKDNQAPKNPPRSQGRQFPSSDIFPADFYVELVATQWLDVKAELANAFYADDVPARGEIYKLMAQNKEIYTRGLDYVAGFLGLRLNKLLVNTLIQEQEYIYHENKPSYAFSGNLKVTFTDSFEWDKNGAWKEDMGKAIWCTCLVAPRLGCRRYRS